MLATQAELAAHLCKADLVTEMVGEFPELQGLMGGYYARAEGLPDAVADAIRDHYKPVGQGDEVPTAAVTVAVALADKLDTIFGFFLINQKPTGSKDPFALRRAALGSLALIQNCNLRLSLAETLSKWEGDLTAWYQVIIGTHGNYVLNQSFAREVVLKAAESVEGLTSEEWIQAKDVKVNLTDDDNNEILKRLALATDIFLAMDQQFEGTDILAFFADRLKVQQREAGVRHDLIDAVFALGGEDDLVRLLARVHALQAFVTTEDGTNLLAGYKRAANILKKEGFTSSPPSLILSLSKDVGEGSGEGSPSSQDAEHPHPTLPRAGEGYEVEPAEGALIQALAAAEPQADSAIAAEDFTAAMAALASLRAPIDAFFEDVTVNDADPVKRAARLGLLDQFRAAVHKVADFSRIEG